MRKKFAVTEELAIESGACKERVREVLANPETRLVFDIEDGELFHVLRAIAWAAYKAGHWDLRGANLCGANLCGADLRGADLCGANLREANLRGADLRGANLCGTDLYGTDMREANLRGIAYDERTKFPIGFDTGPIGFDTGGITK